MCFYEFPTKIFVKYYHFCNRSYSYHPSILVGSLVYSFFNLVSSMCVQNSHVVWEWKWSVMKTLTRTKIKGNVKRNKRKTENNKGTGTLIEVFAVRGSAVCT